MTTGLTARIRGSKEKSVMNIMVLQIDTDKTIWIRLKHSLVDHVYYTTALPSTLTGKNNGNDVSGKWGY